MTLETKTNKKPFGVFEHLNGQDGTTYCLAAVESERINWFLGSTVVVPFVMNRDQYRIYLDAQMSLICKLDNWYKRAIDERTPPGISSRYDSICGKMKEL